MPALRDIAAPGCPSHWLVRFGGEDALVNQDQLVRRRAGKQVLLHDLKVLFVSGYQVHLVTAPLGPVDPHHLVFDAQPAVGRAHGVRCPRWRIGVRLVQQGDSLWQTKI